MSLGPLSSQTSGLRSPLLSLVSYRRCSRLPPCRRGWRRHYSSSKKELEMSRLQQDIGKQVEEKISKDQRRYLLNEQLKRIKKELGIEKDEKEGLVDRFKARIEGVDLPENAATVINDEFAKLESLDPSSSEFNVTKNYLD